MVGSPKEEKIENFVPSENARNVMKRISNRYKLSKPKSISSSNGGTPEAIIENLRF